MKKANLILVFFLLGSSLNSQVSFYVRPKATMKTNRATNFYSFPVFKGPKIIGSNPYFQFYNHGHHFNSNELNLGVNLGLRVSKKQAFEIGFATDNSSIASSIIADSYYSSNENELNFFGTSDFLLYGRSFLRFSIESHTTLIERNRLNVRGQFGLGVFYNQYTKRKQGLFAEESLSLFGFNGINGPNNNLEGTATNISPWPISPIVQFGLGFDFKTKKQKNIVSLDVFYTANFFKSTQVVSYDYTLYLNGEVRNYEYILKSKGSGIYFQLSRTFQVYPIKKKVKLDK